MYWWQFLTVAGIHLLAVASPGPDFVMVSRNALVYSRKISIYSAIGLGLGIIVHVTYSLLGIALIIANSVILFTIIKLLGAAYLIYIGYKALRHAKPVATSEEKVTTHTVSRTITPLAAIRMGFLTNVLNPKATLFFLALFTQIISPETPILWQVAYGIEMSIATFLWFALVATLLSHRHIRSGFRKMQHHFERVFGIILIGLGIKVATSTSN